MAQVAADRGGSSIWDDFGFQGLKPKKPPVTYALPRELRRREALMATWQTRVEELQARKDVVDQAWETEDAVGIQRSCVDLVAGIPGATDVLQDLLGDNGEGHATDSIQNPVYKSVGVTPVQNPVRGFGASLEDRWRDLWDHICHVLLEMFDTWKLSDGSFEAHCREMVRCLVEFASLVEEAGASV